MNENAALEESIRGEADKTLQSINDREVAEIRKLDEVYTFDIEKFRKSKEVEIKEKIGQEIAKINSRAMLERKKLKLGLVEAFIGRIVDEAIAAMRNDARYKRFLADTIAGTMDQILGKVELFLGPEDQVLKKEIGDTMKQDKRADVLIKEDSTIKWGGYIIRDQQGRIFNSTIERIYFRKSSSIRQEVANILKQKGFIE